MKTRVARIALVLALAAGLGLSAANARAQAYKYKDANGHVHFTENYYEVPEKFRKQIETREMPTRLDPNAPGASPDAKTEVAFQDGVRSVSGKDLTVQQQEKLSKWWKEWGTTWMVIGGITILLQLVIHLGLIVHALTNGHVGWGIANVLVGLTTPVYLMVHVEQSIAVRLGLLILYFTPGVAIGIVLSQLVGVLG